jgi:hypothetical protein
MRWHCALLLRCGLQWPYRILEGTIKYPAVGCQRNSKIRASAPTVDARRAWAYDASRRLALAVSAADLAQFEPMPLRVEQEQLDFDGWKSKGSA